RLVRWLFLALGGRRLLLALGRRRLLLALGGRLLLRRGVGGRLPCPPPHEQRHGQRGQQAGQETGTECAHDRPPSGCSRATEALPGVIAQGTRRRTLCVEKTWLTCGVYLYIKVMVMREGTWDARG